MRSWWSGDNPDTYGREAGGSGRRDLRVKRDGSGSGCGVFFDAVNGSIRLLLDEAAVGPRSPTRGGTASRRPSVRKPSGRVQTRGSVGQENSFQRGLAGCWQRSAVAMMHVPSTQQTKTVGSQKTPLFGCEFTCTKRGDPVAGRQRLKFHGEEGARIHTQDQAAKKRRNMGFQRTPASAGSQKAC